MLSLAVVKVRQQRNSQSPSLNRNMT